MRVKEENSEEVPTIADSVKVAFVGTGDLFLKYYLPEAIEQDVYDVTAICDIELERAQKVPISSAERRPTATTTRCSGRATPSSW